MLSYKKPKDLYQVLLLACFSLQKMLPAPSARLQHLHSHPSLCGCPIPCSLCSAPIMAVNSVGALVQVWDLHCLLPSRSMCLQNKLEVKDNFFPIFLNKIK